MTTEYNDYGSEDFPFELGSPFGIYLICNLANDLLEEVSADQSDLDRRSQIEDLVNAKTAGYLRLIGREDVLEDAEKRGALKRILVNRLAVYGFCLGAMVFDATGCDFKGYHHAKILDPMSGARMFYFDKNNKSVLFGDIRDEEHWTHQYKKLEIHPDQIMDARKLEFPDNSFYMVVLDPPHLINCGKNSDMAKSYGVLEKAWHADMKRIFNEAWRVLKPNGTLIFKWADKDVSLSELLYVLGREPVFGDKKPSANKAGTNRFFLVFFKDE